MKVGSPSCTLRAEQHSSTRAIAATREDWAILHALSDVLGKKLPYNSLAALRQALYKAHPRTMRIGQIAPGEPADVEKLAVLGGTADKAPFRSSIANFYFTNPIARSSRVMAAKAVAE